MSVGRDRERTLAYVLRLWCITDGEQPVWRASLRDVHTGERRGFADLEDLYRFLCARVEGARTGAADVERPPRLPRG